MCILDSFLFIILVMEYYVNKFCGAAAIKNYIVLFGAFDNHNSWQLSSYLLHGHLGNPTLKFKYNIVIDHILYSP